MRTYICLGKWNGKGNGNEKGTRTRMRMRMRMRKLLEKLRSAGWPVNISARKQGYSHTHSVRPRHSSMNQHNSPSSFQRRRGQWERPPLKVELDAVTNAHRQVHLLLSSPTTGPQHAVQSTLPCGRVMGCLHFRQSASQRRTAGGM